MLRTTCVQVCKATWWLSHTTSILANLTSQGMMKMRELLMRIYKEHLKKVREKKKPDSRRSNKRNRSKSNRNKQKPRKYRKRANITSSIFRLVLIMDSKSMIPMQQVLRTVPSRDSKNIRMSSISTRILLQITTTMISTSQVSAMLSLSNNQSNKNRLDNNLHSSNNPRR